MTRVVAIGGETIRKGLAQIVGCEACSPEAEIPFCWVLDAVTGLDGAWTDYILVEPAPCTRCRRRMAEETLVEWL